MHQCVLRRPPLTTGDKSGCCDRTWLNFSQQIWQFVSVWSVVKVLACLCIPLGLCVPDGREVRKCSSDSSWFCVQGADSVSSWDPGPSVAFLLDGQAVYAESVPVQGFS